jgi:multimeric flavodoxin WrbA
MRVSSSFVHVVIGLVPSRAQQRFDGAAFVHGLVALGGLVEGKGQVEDLAGFTNSGAKNGDRSSTLGYFVTMAAQHGMYWVSLGLQPSWAATTGSENDLNRLGYFIGAAAQTPVDAGPEAVHKSDIATAEHLGARVARQTAFFLAGRAALAA